MVQFTAPIVFFLSIASVSTALFTKRTVPQVKADIAAISTSVTNLDNAITAYPLTGGTLLAALGIHNSAVALIGTLKTATADVISTGPVGATDGEAILDSVEVIVPTIKHALVQIVVKKPAFQALPIGGLPALILQDLTYLKGNTSLFSNALITNAPSTLVAEATALRDDVLAAFDPAIAAYTP